MINDHANGCFGNALDRLPALTTFELLQHDISAWKKSVTGVMCGRALICKRG
jgi:hypothetical protein